MAGMGHNGGPTMEPGFGFRKYAWGRARAELLPSLPLQIVRIRVARAQRLGLDYKTYATIRAASGRDITGFLFSGNALSIRPGRLELPGAVGQRLAELDGAADRIVAVYAPAHPDAVLAANPGRLDSAASAPGFTDNWATLRTRIRAALRGRNMPPDGVVLVAATTVEREWRVAGKLAGVLAVGQMFHPGP
ncbi:MAG: hypothetical protein GDA52_03375 [Rhodobacteraceae bacterium]|nr:hypothetical protein [Paracoccaceae bacterium]